MDRVQSNCSNYFMLMTSRAHILFKKASAVHQKQATRPLGATESIVPLYNGVFCVGVFNISRTKQQKPKKQKKPICTDMMCLPVVITT